jgi:hypothetical protein
MNIQDFVNRAKAQDERNVFECGTGTVPGLPQILTAFFQKANPTDVEVSMDGGTVRFFPEEELEDLQSEYSLDGGRYVFASSNGDPIYVYQGKIYTCCHGTHKIQDELMAESFEAFLELID